MLHRAADQIAPLRAASLSARAPLSPTSHIARERYYDHRYLYASRAASAVNFIELWVFDVNQRVAGASAAGASLSMLTTYYPNIAAYGGDMLSDPVALISPNLFANSGCGDTLDYYQAVFPAPVNINSVRTWAVAARHRWKCALAAPLCIALR